MPRPKEYDKDLAQKVLAMRRGGAPFDAIAERLDLTPQSAKALFDKAISANDPELSIALEADRLDRLHMAAWPAAVAGELGAIDRILKIAETRNKVVSTPRRNKHALREAFDESAATSEQLNVGWDRALLEAGRQIADRVDAAVASGDNYEATKALYLVPHMVNVLREMLATPSSRAAAEAKIPAPPPAAPEPSKQETRLARLRSIHIVQSGEVGTG